MIRRPPRSTLSSSSAASDVYKRQVSTQSTWEKQTIKIKNKNLTRFKLMQGEKKQCQSQRKRKFIALMSGGIAGITSRTCTAPLERIIILKQTKHPDFIGKNIFNNFHTIISREGISGLFRGNFLNCVRTFPHTSLEFFLFPVLNGKITNFINHLPLPLKKALGGTVKNLISGCLSGMIGNSVVYPLDIAKNLATIQKQKLSVGGMMSKIVKDKGIIGLYRGWVPTMMSIGPFTSCKWTAFEIMRKSYIKLYLKKDNAKLSFVENFLLGGFSGCIAMTIIYPLSLISRRMMTSAMNPNVEKKSIKQMIDAIIKDEGFKNLYAGLPISWIKLFPTAAIAFAVNGQVTKFGQKLLHVEQQHQH
eukprot:TRINITY_DN825_c0_g1_i3.p1 TRINITY_DN825_c0_g1~~TRINITY_DN825_c0_g1_i3.p1  ORF type:complete len:361 (+),score=52.05 TRINITY_DN825_c0_g1_i3:71-1153(+)